MVPELVCMWPESPAAGAGAPVTRAATLRIIVVVVRKDFIVSVAVRVV